MDGIGKAHSQEYGVSPAVIVEVPQVTTILGAFSEFCQGYAIMGTNSHGLRVAMSPREDSSVRIFNASSGTERKKFQLTAIRQRKEDKWGQVVKAICQNMIAAGLGINGFDMTFKGQSADADSPTLTGALVSGMIMALNKLYNLGCDKSEMIRLAYGANRFATVYASRLRDLITIFTAEEGKVIFFISLIAGCLRKNLLRKWSSSGNPAERQGKPARSSLPMAVSSGTFQNGI